MLYNLQPSIDVTGGPWFTDSELDTEFISSLLSIVFRFVASESFPGDDHRRLSVSSKPRKRNSSKATQHEQLSFPASYSKYPTVSSIHEFVRNSGITTVDLAPADIKSLIDVLVYDGKIEPIDEGMAYRAIPGATPECGADLGADAEIGGGVVWDALTEVPCGPCLVSDLCRAGGPVSAEECIYLDEWLIQ